MNNANKNMKGLESLIPQRNANEPNSSNKRESVFLIDVDLIKPNPYQPRKEFDEKELHNLADSIKVYGILQPLIVTKVERDVPSGREVEYELIAGERRLRAAKMANLPRVPVIIKRSTNKEKLELSLIENIQRNDLGVLEEALAFKQLQEEFKLKNTEIADRVSKSASYVANTLRVLTLPEEIKTALASEKISEGHTRPLLALKSPEDQKKLFNEITSRNLTVRQAEERGRELGARTYKNTDAKNQGKAKVDPELKDLVEKLKDSHNLADVRLRTDGRKASLALHFSSKKDLEEWINSLLK